MTDLEKLCFILEELNIPYVASGTKLGVTTKVTVKENYKDRFTCYWFRLDGSIKPYETAS
jgi:hypothetical protein